MKWNISEPDVVEPFADDEAATLIDSAEVDISCVELRLVPREDDAVAELDANE